jgi:hypothetical protein
VWIGLAERQWQGGKKENSLQLSGLLMAESHGEIKNKL